jgi:hypothetical protein
MSRFKDPSTKWVTADTTRQGFTPVLQSRPSLSGLLVVV